MDITLERTRIIFTNYTDYEHKKIEDLVATSDRVFFYEDLDNHMICIPTGMLNSVKQVFPGIKITDNSKTYWEYETITPVHHNAKPRNQLQIDFIKFVLEQADKKQKVAGVLNPGTGKCQSINSKIYTPDGYKLMGDIKVGDEVLGTTGKPIEVLNVYPQGIKDIYEITLVDKRKVKCTIDHLWKVSTIKSGKTELITLGKLMRRHYKDYAIPVGIPQIYIPIESIKYSHKEESQCILVDSDDHLYMTDDEIITHNTFMACYSAIKVNARTLIIVPTSGIKVQWGETLTKMFNVSSDKVKLVSTPKDFINITADFVVVSQASLAVLNKTYNLEKIMKYNKFGIKIIDEVQMWFHNIIKVDGNSNICHNWYLTGTFGRSGSEENNLYQQMFGDLVIFREKNKNPTLFNPRPGNIYGMKPHMNVKMIWGNSKLSPEEVESVMTSVRYSERTGKWMRYGMSIPSYVKLIIPDDGTMTPMLKTILKVIKMAEKEVTYGKTLILGNTINSCEIIASYVQRMFPDKKVYTYHSRHTKEENAKAKAEADILCSTIQSAGTGFDLKGLSKLITYAVWKSWILSSQISGRLRRRDDGKETYMWDIVDSRVPQLRAWANVRVEEYKRSCKTFKIVDMK